MDWNALGSIAEILGALGVIASLLYLSRQIHQNTQATRLAMSHSLATAVRDWNRPMVTDPDLAITFQRGVEDPAQLDDTERSRFMQMCFSFFRMFEDIHYQFSHGALERDVWEAHAKNYGTYAKSPGMQAYWRRRREIFRPAFREFIDSDLPDAIVRLDELVRQTGPSAEGAVETSREEAPSPEH